jgi:hypothetical protein
MSEKKNIAHTRPNKVPMVEKVRQHYLTAGTRNPVLLTEIEDEYRRRLMSVWALLCRYHSDEQVRAIHMKNTGLSQSAAYADIRNAISLFGDVRRSEKEGRRHQMYEWCVRTWQMAADAGDVKAMNRALENMMTLMGLNQPDGDAPDFTKLEAGAIIALLPEGMERSIQAMLQGGAINLNKIPVLEYEEAESESGDSATEGD